LKINQRGEAALTPAAKRSRRRPCDTPTSPHRSGLVECIGDDPLIENPNWLNGRLPGRIKEFFEKVYESVEALALPH
jgi:hypothetical protein